jgi:hypothetical protein
VTNAPSPDEKPTTPFLRVVSGNPTTEELAAVVAVIAARSGAAEDDEAPEISGWADRTRGLRTVLPHGDGAWRASVFPR